MRITAELLHTLLTAFPTVPPEAGGILGSGDGGKTVTHFVYDPGIVCLGRAIYTPNTEFLNQKIAEMGKNGIKFCGLVHSHPPTQDSLSEDDRQYLRRVMAAMPSDISAMYAPIVLPNTAVIPFSIHRENNAIMKEPLEVIPFEKGGK